MVKRRREGTFFVVGGRERVDAFLTQPIINPPIHQGGLGFGFWAERSTDKLILL